MSLPSPEVSRWRRLLAVVLSITPGCGHVLLGRWRRGAVWLGALLLLQASLPLTGFPGFVLMLGTWVGAAVDVARLRPPEQGVAGVTEVLLGLVCFWSVSAVVGKTTRLLVTEPFRIPSVSMQPTLHLGDQFYTDKSLGAPLRRRAVERGEVIVFDAPPQPQSRFVMRVVALAGDSVALKGGQLQVGGHPVKRTPLGGCEGLEATAASCRRYEEVLDGHVYQVLLDEGPGGSSFGDFPFARQGCPRGMEPHTEGCVVPPGHVFVLGDNRDNANDSRYWGPLPVENVTGTARFIHFSWTPGSGVRWSRLGIPVH